MNLKKFLPKSAPRITNFFPIRFFYVNGNCMEPSFTNTDLVLGLNCRWPFVKLNDKDIVCAKINNSIYIKRFHRLKNGKTILTADNVPNWSMEIDSKNIIAKITKKIFNDFIPFDRIDSLTSIIKCFFTNLAYHFS